MHFVAEYLASEQRAGSRDYQLFVEARCDQLLIVAIKSRPAPTCFAITIPHALQTTFPEMLSQELQNRHDF